MMGLLEFLWRQLPDRCEMPHCTRRGIRGNENRMEIAGKMRTICDECTQIELFRRRSGEDYADLQKTVMGEMNKDQP
jgi:hypothetical protein